jgi:hypothetical protein
VESRATRRAPRFFHTAELMAPAFGPFTTSITHTYNIYYKAPRILAAKPKSENMWLQHVAVFISSQAPEHKKPESPGKAKKDYLPTSKRLDINRFPWSLSGKIGWIAKLKTRVRIPAVSHAKRVEKKRKMSFL